MHEAEVVRLKALATVCAATANRLEEEAIFADPSAEVVLLVEVSHRTGPAVDTLLGVKLTPVVL